ncbi:MAG: hypothetical protein ABIJ09_20935 [Pseudomonadota bacterium]
MVSKTEHKEESGYRIEFQSSREWVTARTDRLDEQHFVVSSASEVAVGSPLNVLVYIPRDDDVDLIKTRARVVRCDDKQGVFEIEARLEVFAPGDERRWRLWWRAQNALPHRALPRPPRNRSPKVA